MNTLDETNAAEILGIVRQLSAAYRQEADKYTQQAYLMGLLDLPIERIRLVAIQAIRSGEKFMPTVAELRRMAGAELSTESRAVVAFDALSSAVARAGAYRSIRFDDPILNTTVQSLGGWIRVCDTPEAEWDSHFRHRFVQAYRGNVEAKRGTMHAQRGIAEVENTHNGLAAEPPVLISVDLPKLPGVSYTLPEERNHRLRDESAKLLTDFGRIDSDPTAGTHQ
jgi:hypothetical protein